MRSSRLLAILLSLQRTGSTTAPELATEFEVSVRTIYRDVSALQAAGVPLYTNVGAGGGIHLVEQWRAPFDGMTTEEARALVVGGGPAADLGLGSVLAIARSKLRSGMPASTRAELDRVEQRFLLDTTGWFRSSPVAPGLEIIAQAVWTATRLDIRYQRGDQATSRRLDPLGLVLKNNVWYLVARHRKSPRTYRVSRIVAARLRPEGFERPSAFSLEQYWADSAQRFDRDLRPIEIEILVPAEDRASLRAAVPGNVTNEAIESATTEPDGRLRIRLPVESLAVAADQLVGLADVEVVAPAALRRRLRQHGEALIARNR